MVGVAAAVVADGSALALWHGIQIGDQLFDALALPSAAFQSSVHLIDVRLMVVGVMDFHRACVNVRLQRIVRVGQFGK
jgi:hypothetical protein